MILYNVPHSNFGAKVLTAVAIKGVGDHIEVQEPPGGLRSDAYRSVVPTGQVPALVDDDLMISESEAIVEYLNEAFPDPPLLPADLKQRARARFLSRFHDIHFEPPIRKLFWQVPERTRNLSRIEETFGAIRVQLERFNRLATPDPYLVGDQVSLAECGFPATLMYVDLFADLFGHEVDYASHILRWRETLTATPGVREILAETDAAGHAWLSRKLME